MKPLLFVGTLSLVLASLISSAFAQPAHFWSQRFGAAGADFPRAVTTDPAGNVILVGIFFAPVDFGGGALPDPGGSNDMFVAKYSPSGVHLWSKAFVGSPRSVATDASGNVLVTGNFQVTTNFGGGPLSALSLDDVFIVKFDANGVHQWSHAYGNTADMTGENGTGVAVDDAGSCVVTGVFNGSTDFGGGALVSAGNSDVFIAKFDASGSHQWSQRFGGQYADRGDAVAIDDGNNAVVVGDYLGSVDFGGGPIAGWNGSPSAFVARLDPSGAHQWSRGFPAAASFDKSDATSVVIDLLGSPVVVGVFSGSNNFGGANLATDGTDDIFVARYDENGTHIWSKRFGATGLDRALDVAENSSGIFITGRFDAPLHFGGGNLTSAGNTDMFCAKLSLAGNHLWSLRAGSTAADEGLSITADATGKVVMAGMFRGTVDFGGGGLISAGGDDVGVVAYQEDTTVPVLTATPLRASLHQNVPNPFNPSTSIQYTISDPVTVVIEVFEPNGAIVARMDEGYRGAGTHSVDWDGRDREGQRLASGIYFYRLAGMPAAGTRKMVLLK